MVLILRIVRAGIVAALLVALTGWILQRSRFGSSDQAAASRVQAELQQRIDRSSDTLGGIAAQVASQMDAMRAAPRDTAAARQLFDAVDAALADSSSRRTGITVYDTAGTPLAWGGRVSEITKARLDGQPSLFVALGAPGPRLIRTETLLDRARVGSPRLATIVVEEGLGNVTTETESSGPFVVSTSIAPATLRPAGIVPRTTPYQFQIVSRTGRPLVDAVVATSDLAEARTRWGRTTLAAAVSVLAVTLLLCTGPMVELRRRTRRASTFLGATVALAAVLIGARAVLLFAVTLIVGPRPSTSPSDLLMTALTVGAIAWLIVDLIERRRFVKPRPGVLPATPRSAVLIGAAYLACGALAAALIWQYERVLADVVSRTNFDLLHVSHYPVSAGRISLALGLLLLHAAVIWLAAAIGRAPRLVWRASAAMVREAAVPAWLIGAVTTIVWLNREPSAAVPAAPMLVALAAAGGCAIALGRFGPLMRHGSQAMRLFALLLALLVPPLAMYPSLHALAIDARERLVANVYAPEAASQRQGLQARTQRALQQVDRLPGLANLIAADDDTGRQTSAKAFSVWSLTDLARYRLTSAVELYAADGRLVSRFALNLPEYSATRFRADSCGWALFDEPSPLGSNESHVLGASRAICERSRVVGSIVIRTMLDYRTLPFIAPESPYLEMLQRDQNMPEGLSERDTEFVVYGWSRAPIFSSGTSVWSLPDDVFQRMSESRTPLWQAIDREGQRFRVYFFSDRSGIYALGYPVITWFGHMINLVELGTLAFALYVVLLIGATIFNLLTSRTPSSGRALLREIRSSFYRKLSLAFVLSAVVPVVILAIATRTYFATELRAGIDEAAAKTATVAQRLVEDYAALQQRGSGGLETIDDQIMVLVRRAIDQDVNLFDRARLQATSERDFFESELLSARTPPDVYRSIVLNRLPTYVGEEEVGNLKYRVAAAPVRAGGREGIVTVPLTLRQQDIEQQIDELDHRVLFGAVLFSLLGAALGYWMAERIADPVSRLTRATRRIARGDLDARIAATSSDELRRLVEDFNQMAADLKRQRADLERSQRLEAWADMARQVAHDIKNPLTPIQLSAEHARRVNFDRGRPLSPVLDECVNSILTQVKLLRQIAGEFSSFASSPTAKPEATALGALIEQVVEPYRTGLSGRIAIDVTAPPELPLVHIDPTLFARALTNVVENALYAMPGTGRLTIAVSPNPAATNGTPAMVDVEIRDTGVGMDPQALARLFEPYFSTKATGTGLGLTIAKRNVELNGGAIHVMSERGVGTTVTLTLPAEPA